MTDVGFRPEKVIIFQLQDEEFAIPVHNVRSIEKLQHITKVPRTNKCIKGVINLRGVVTPIIDLRIRLGLKENTFDDRTRIIIVSLNGSEVGLIVDAANDVLDIDFSRVEPTPEVVGAIEAEYVDGVITVENRLLSILNLENALIFEQPPSLKGM